MAKSKCPRCESTDFEMEKAEPKGSRFKMMFIQCASCGAVVGVTDYFDISALLDQIARRLGILDLLGEGRSAFEFEFSSSRRS